MSAAPKSLVSLEKPSRAGFLGPVLALILAVFLADMTWQRHVAAHAEACTAYAADHAARALAAADPGATDPTAAWRERGIEAVRLQAVEVAGQPGFLDRYHAIDGLGLQPGAALDPNSLLHKSIADAALRARAGDLRPTPLRAGRDGATFDGQQRAAVGALTPASEVVRVAVARVPVVDWSSEARAGRLLLLLAFGGACLFWLPLLRRRPLRRWFGPVGAAVALTLLGAALLAAESLLATRVARWAEGIAQLAGALANTGTALELPSAAAVFAAPVLPLVLVGLAGWYTESRRSPHRAAYAYIAPALVGMGALVLAPFAFGVLLSFMKHRQGVFTWVGLENFWRILSSEGQSLTDATSFYFTLGVTVLWTLVNVVFHTGIGLGLALVLREPTLRFTGVWRVLLIVPWAVPNYITALVWKGMFNQQYGLINHVLATVGIEPVAWFSGFFTAFSANVTTNTWLGFPFMMVVSLGALQSIPRDLYEAADIDGIGRWAQFRHLTLPLLKPALFPAIILGSIWTFNMFNIIYLVSGGQPDGATDILITEAYRLAFEQDRYGYAAAYSMLIFVVLFGYTLLTNRISRGVEEAS
jgi:ABC-type sugar transport system permease subunit